jgi:hypothetical protein
VALLARLIVLFSVCALIALVPLAFATPPDPAWISGYWDDGDFDDVVIAVYGAAAVVGDLSPAFGAPGWTPLVVRPPASSLAKAPVSAGLIRAPPAI